MGAWQTERQESGPDFRLWFVELQWSSSWPVEGLLSCPDCSWENSWSEIPPPCSLSAWIPEDTFPKHLSSWLCLRLPVPSATSLCQVPPSAFGVPKDSRPSPPGLSDLQPLSITAEQIRHSSFSHLTQEEQESQSPKSGSRDS